MVRENSVTVSEQVRYVTSDPFWGMVMSEKTLDFLVTFTSRKISENIDISLILGGWGSLKGSILTQRTSHALLCHLEPFLDLISPCEHLRNMCSRVVLNPLSPEMTTFSHQILYVVSVIDRFGSLGRESSPRSMKSTQKWYLWIQNCSWRYSMWFQEIPSSFF